MRRVSNPPNPWLGRHVEWLEEPPPVEIEVFEEEARSILATNDSPDVPFRYSVNPYRGCQHACAYCYARPGHQHLGFGAGTDFDSKIVVKRNAAELLRRELRRPKMRGEWVAFSGVTDCYQPLEASYGLTRSCLEVCRDLHTPVGLITKSALVRRDADLLGDIAGRGGARVFLSIPFAREEVARAIEPWASSPKARFETLRRLGEAGIPTGVALAPLIPGLAEPDIPEILERAREAGATSAFMILLRLPGEARRVFEERLRAVLPLRAERVLSAMDEMHQAHGRTQGDFGVRFRGAGARWEAIEGLFEIQKRRLGFLDGEERDPARPVDSLRPEGAGPTSVQGRLFPD